MEKVELINPSNVREVLNRHLLADGLNLVFDLERSRGSRIYDAKAGEFYLDFFSCVSTAPLGYNPPRLTARSDIGTGDAGSPRTAVDACYNGRAIVGFLDGAVVAKFPRELGYVTDASGKFVNDGGASNRYFSGEGRDLDPPVVPGK